MTKKLLCLLVALLVGLTLGMIACVGDAGKAKLEDAVWKLESYGEPNQLESVLQGTELTVEFVNAEGEVRGSGGCNSYSGSYEVNGSKLSIIPPLMSTMMSCSDPIDSQEYEFLQTLEAAESYKIDGQQLTIACGNKILIFRQK
ncbi:MAG: META domain-containing protein [Chloroflexi bacterium]|nr:META domain-containing protein [Chloroflexota bacterium]